MKKNYFWIVLLLSNIAFSQPTFNWAKSMGGTDNDRVSDVAADADGNSYVTGEFKSATFTAGSFSITKTASWDGFVTKYNASGQVQWVKGIFGSGSESPKSVDVDAGGNVYVLGTYTHTLTIGPLTLPSAQDSNIDCFLAKFDASGTPMWLKRIHSPSVEYATTVMVANDGNILITGGFQGLTFTVDDLVLNNANLVVDVGDIFLIKFDPNGNVIWGRREGGQGSDLGSAMACATDGSIYLTGYYGSQTMTVGTQTATNGSNQLNTWIWNGDIYVIKYDSNGTPLWLRAYQGPLHDFANAITLDGEENVVVSGNFNNNITIGTTLLSGTSQPMFMFKLNPAGEVQWANKMSTGDVKSKGMAHDAAGNILSLVDYNIASTFGGVQLPVNAEGGSFGIVKTNADGVVQWVKGEASILPQYGLSIATDPNGNIFTAVTFTSATFNFDQQMVTNTVSTMSDGAVAKIGTESLGVATFDQSDAFLYPNPADQMLYINGADNQLEVELYDANGRKLYECSNTNAIDVSGLSQGVYLIKTASGNHRFVKK